MHILFKINLKDDNAYAVDFTGAQYGLYRCVELWDQHISNLGAKVKESHPIGSYTAAKRKEEIATLQKMLQEAHVKIDQSFKNDLSRSHIVDRLLIATDAWVKNHNASMVKIAKGDIDTYTNETEKLRKYVVKCVRDYVAYMNKLGGIMEVEEVIFKTRWGTMQDNATTRRWFSELSEFSLSADVLQRLKMLRYTGRQEITPDGWRKMEEARKTLGNLSHLALE